MYGALSGNILAFGGWLFITFNILTSGKSVKYRKSYINFLRDLFILRTFENGGGGGGLFNYANLVVSIKN